MFLKGRVEEIFRLDTRHEEGVVLVIGNIFGFYLFAVIVRFSPFFYSVFLF